MQASPSSPSSYTAGGERKVRCRACGNLLGVFEAGQFVIRLGRRAGVRRVIYGASRVDCENCGAVTYPRDVPDGEVRKERNPDVGGGT